MNQSAALKPTPLPLPGVMWIPAERYTDDRGRFTKTFHAGLLSEIGPAFELREEYYSESRRGVLRGMHFQTPPHAHTKLVSCLAGRVSDVLVDLRRGSPSYGKHCSLSLDADRPGLLWIPPGLAHGFLTLTDSACLLYRTDREYAPDYDEGIRWDSFGFRWSLPDQMIIMSARDRRHLPLTEFESPFAFDAGQDH